MCVHVFWGVSYPRIGHSRPSDSDSWMFDVIYTRTRSAVQRETVEIAKNGGGGMCMKMNSVTPDKTCNCGQIRSSHVGDCEDSCGLGCGGVAFHVNIRMFRKNILPPCSGPHFPFHSILHATVIHLRV